MIGGVPVPRREAMVARFQAGQVPVFLLSLKAGGTGLTLTRAADIADAAAEVTELRAEFADELHELEELAGRYYDGVVPRHGAPRGPAR
jgi:hypothetical protein